MGNIERARATTALAVADGAKIVVLPELLNSGYVFNSKAEAESAGLSISDPIFDRFAEVLSAHDAFVVGGFAIADSNKLWNASVIIDGSGVRGWYPKAHLFATEPDFFEAGSAQPLVIETPYGRLGTLICYDIEFPEWVRKLAIGGAQIIAVPTNWPKYVESNSTTPMEVVRLQAAASVNKMVAIAADRAGSERGIEWVCASAITDCDGVIQVIADQNRRDEIQILIADVEVPVDHKIGVRNDVLGDRRLDLY